MSSCESLQSFGGGGPKINKCLHHPGRPIFISIDIILNIFTYAFTLYPYALLAESEQNLHSGSSQQVACTNAAPTKFQHIYNKFVTWEFDVLVAVHRDKFL